MTRLLLGLAAPLSLLACDSIKDAVATGEPQTSYCEALCDWAVSCADEERGVDVAALTASCLAEAEAADPDCAAAGAGELDPISSEALAACTEAIAESAGAGECAAFTGSIDELKAGTPPAACATQGADAQATFTEVQSATTESNEELCERFTESFCVQLDTCITADLFGGSIPSEVTDLLGDPVDLCVSELDAVTSTCVAEDLYSPEEDLSDLNTARQGARECLAELESLSCEQLFSGKVPELCGASFTDTETALSFFEALAGIAVQYQNAQ